MFSGVTLLVATVIAMIGLLASQNTPTVHASHVLSFYLDCPVTEVEEGESVDVFLVQATETEGHYRTIGANWHTDEGTADATDYVHQNTDRIWGSEDESRANRVKRTVETREDALLEGDETFTVRFSPVSLVVDRDDPDLDEQCEITIIDDDVHAVSAVITSSPASGDTYRYGETVEFSLTFSGALEVEGSRHLSLRVGSQGSAGWRGATYRSGSGTKTLVFGYTVQPADLDDDGVSVLGTWVEDGVVRGIGGSGTIKVNGTDTVVTPTFIGLSNQSGHKINGQPYPKTISITSTPVSTADTYGHDEVIQVSVSFDQGVDAGEGSLAILRIGSYQSQRYAQYASGSGTDTLVFEYTVVEKDRDDNGVAAFVPHGLDIKASGTDIAYQPNPDGETPEMPENPNHKVNGSLVDADTTSPTVSSLSFVDPQGPGDDSTYGVGDWIGVVVTFSESVVVDGAPQVELNIGGVARTAEYGHPPRGTKFRARTVSSPAVLFGYTVQEGDSDTDGIAIGANKLSLNGGVITDKAGNAAVLTHDAVADDSARKVDAPDVTGPTVSSVAITSDPGDDNTYGNGDAIKVTVIFSEDVTITGTPQLELDIGGTAKMADYESATGPTVIFSYTVAVGDADTDGVSIGENKLSLNGGAIQDAAGNDAMLTHDASEADSGHKVSAPGGL